jgi:hypothetical protein
MSTTLLGTPSRPRWARFWGNDDLGWDSTSSARASMSARVLRISLVTATQNQPIKNSEVLFKLTTVVRKMQLDRLFSSARENREYIIHHTHTFRFRCSKCNCVCVGCNDVEYSKFDSLGRAYA